MTSEIVKKPTSSLTPPKRGLRGSVLSAAASALFAAGLPVAAFALPTGGAAGGEPLNFCADPDDLPFSAQSGGAPGLYLELGQAVAGALGRPFNAVWSQSYFGKRTVRETLLAGKCDAYIGLPDSKNFMGPKLIFSKPFLNVGYALVSRRGSALASLADLKGKRVAVQFSSSPELLIADYSDIEAVTVLDPETAMKALAAGKADAAIIWGPSAGYLNKALYQDAFIVEPVSGEGMQWRVSVGFAKSHADLRDEIDRILEASGDKIAALAAKYGFPEAEPVSLTVVGRPAAPDAPKIVLAADDKSAGDTTGTPAPAVAAAEAAAPAAPAPAGASDPAVAAAGREIYNGTCSHCHGPDAVVGQKRIDLRLLNQRYGDKMDEVFHYTVTHGRPDKGMPNWTGVFSEDDFSKILAYLHTVQN